MSDSKGRDHATKGAMHHVECVIRDAEPANKGIIPAGHNHQWNHVDDCKSTGAITKVFQLGDNGAMPLNTVGPQNDIHGNDSRK